MTVMIDDEVQARFQAVAAPDEDFSAFLAAAAKDAIARRKWEADGRAEMQAMLDGPRHRFDPDATYRKYKEKFGWDDLPPMTTEELEAQGDAILASLPPEKIAEMERLGLI